MEIWDRSMDHSWKSGWLPMAVASLFRQNQSSDGLNRDHQNKK
jgi:hypothetical protein